MIEGALAIKETFEKLNLASYLKVTGGKGLHLHVPILPKYTWNQVKNF
jgi:bifunctional non-homologous end joining protein LigD